MNKYSFDDIWILKDGEYSICPQNAGMIAPAQKSLTLAGKPTMERLYLYCNRSCMFMKDAVKKEEGKPDVPGVVLMCQGRNIFYEIT